MLTGQITKSNGIRRCTDGGANTTDIGGNGHSKNHGFDTIIFGVNMGQQWRQQGQHHGGGGSIAHEHGEESGNRHQSEHHFVVGTTNGLEQHSSQVNIQFVLGGRNGDEKTTQKQYDYGCCEAAENVAVAEYCLWVESFPEKERTGVGDGYGQ